MNVALLNAPVTLRSEHSHMTPPLGLAYLASVLRIADHHVSAIDFNVSGLALGRVDRILDVDKPSLVGISALTETYPNALAIARRVKEKDPRVKVVLGGAHASIMPRDVLAEPSVDFVVVGDGVTAMRELADHLAGEGPALESIAGLGYKSPDVRLNPAGALSHPDDLPLPARDLFPLHRYRDAFNVLTATGGCPYRCPFCSGAAVWEGRRRMRSADSIVGEIEGLVRDYGMREIFFTDDLFTLNQPWVRRLLDALADFGRPLSWGCSTRVDLVDADLLQAMAEGGCRSIQFGVESGSQEILDSVKGIDKDRVVEAVAAAVEAGMSTVCSFMVPFPQDTPETLRETREFMKVLAELGAHISLSYTAPFPGTRFYEDADDLGLRILTKDWAEYDAKHVIFETAHLSASQIADEVGAIAYELNMIESRHD